MKAKKVWAARIAVSLSLVATLCSVGAPLATTKGLATASARPVALSIFASPPSDVVNLNTNWFTKYVQKTFGMQIKWVIAPSSDVTTKQNLLLASGDYPEVFWSGNLTPVQEEKYGQEGVLVPLNKYIHQYTPHIEKAMREVPGLKQAMVAPDGNIYGIPQINWCFHCFWSSKFWINITWLKEEHLSMPTTTTQFLHVLEVFKSHPPHAMKNVIPLAGASNEWHSDPTTFLMNAFIYDDGDNATAGNTGADRFFIQNRKVAFAPVQPQWRQGLAYLHELYQRGLITTNTFFTQNADQLISEVRQGRVGVFADGASNDLINYGAPGSDWQYWRVVPPLKGPHGVNYAAFYGNGPSNVQFAITNKATPAQIRAIMKLADFVFTLQGAQLMDFGPQGVFWKPAKKGQQGYDGHPALFDTDWNKAFAGLQNYGWNQMGLIYQSALWFDSAVAEPEFAPAGSQTLLYDLTKQFYAGHQPKLVYPAIAATWIPPAQAKQYDMMQTNINSFVSQWTDQFIVGSKDLNKDWNTYVQGVNNLGLQLYLQLAQRAMGKPFDTTSPLFRGGY